MSAYDTKEREHYLDKIAAQRTEIERLRKALGWFAHENNWREEELFEGVYFSAEWKLGYDPRAMARAVLDGIEGAGGAD